jgi:hypothetical protein
VRRRQNGRARKSVNITNAGTKQIGVQQVWSSETSNPPQSAMTASAAGAASKDQKSGPAAAAQHHAAAEGVENPDSLANGNEIAHPFLEARPIVGGEKNGSLIRVCGARRCRPRWRHRSLCREIAGPNRPDRRRCQQNVSCRPDAPEQSRSGCARGVTSGARNAPMDRFIFARRATSILPRCNQLS